MSPFQGKGVILLFCLVGGAYGGEIAKNNEVFPVFEACQMKYGYFPVKLMQHRAHTFKTRKIPGKGHNQGLEECQQTFYRQKFCRNQNRELRGESYQRICKAFNPQYLKFFAIVFGVIGCGAFLRTIIKLFKINLPYSVLLMMIGMGLGSLTNITSICPQWTAFTKVARTPPTVILYVFLPVLIFESSFNMKSHLFFRSFISIIVLALPGMMITTFATAALCQIFFFSYQWTFWEAVLFGSIISATDPVAVVSILKEVGTSETLGILVDGESLLNDGVAIVLFEVFSEFVNANDTPLPDSEGHNLLNILWVFVRITLGGPMFGWVVAKFTIAYLSMIFNDAAVEVSVTLCAAYLTYFVSEAYLSVSGVMALVFLGITLSSERTCISPEVQGLVSHFWEMLSYLSNTVLFVLVGIVITETAANSFKPEDGYYLVFLYFALNITRLVMIGILSPLLSRIGYGLSWQNMLVMTWGGLRGAVGICLALQVFKNRTICHRENIGPKILLHTAGIVILTLLVNGTTTKKLLDMLKLTELSGGRIQDMANAVRQIRSAQHRSLRILRHDRFLSDADWEIVEETTNVVNPYVEMKVRAKEQEDDLEDTPSLLLDVMVDGGKGHLCPTCDTAVENEPSPDEIRELTEEARLRLLKALKVSCWSQYEQGILTEPAVQVLTDLLEKTEDHKYVMVHASDFNKYWEVSGFFFWLRKKMVPYTTGSFETEEYPLPKEPWRHIYHRIATSLWFTLVIYLVIIANMVPAGMEAYYNTLLVKFTYEEHLYFYLTNVAFTLIYLLELFVKVAGIGFGEYMNSKWNMADLAILIITMVEVILSGTYLKDELNTARNSKLAVIRNPSAQEADFLKFVRFLRLARVTRIFRFFKPVIPIVMKYLNTKVNKKIFHSYDVAKGFVVAVDDVQKFLPQMIDNVRVLLKFKASLEVQRIEVIRQMGLLQKEHPGIAIAVKTRHASRAVLNHIKESISELKEDGLVDEKEYVCLMEELEQKMKHLWDSPAYMKPPMSEITLANVAWLSVSQSSGKELYEFIYKQASLLTYMAGDVICDVGDNANGVYVIVSGLVKITFEPTFQSVTEREGYGVLPNVEVCSDVTFETEMGDFFTTGAVIGEIGVLTDQPRGGSVICETAATLYHIPHSVMKQAIESFRDPYDSLEARLWRTIGMRLAAALLPTEPSFSSWTMDKVKTYLELSAVPIGERYKELAVPNFVSDVVVIYGQVCNFNDMEQIFTAPCVLPKNVERVVTKPNTAVPSRMLIIASQDVEHWAESDDEDDEGSNRKGGFGGQDASNKGSEISLQKFIIAGTKGASITEEEALGIQLHRQSRAVNFGVVNTHRSLPRSRSKMSLKSPKIQSRHAERTKRN